MTNDAGSNTTLITGGTDLAAQSHDWWAHGTVTDRTRPLTVSVDFTWEG